MGSEMCIRDRVIVGPREALQRSIIHLEDINWLGEGDFGSHLDGLSIAVKIRSTRPPAPAKFILDDGKIIVELLEPEFGISPGQACVFYEARDDAARTLGGGWISQTE